MFVQWGEPVPQSKAGPESEAAEAVQEAACAIGEDAAPAPTQKVSPDQTETEKRTLVKKSRARRVKKAA